MDEADKERPILSRWYPWYVEPESMGLIGVDGGILTTKAWDGWSGKRRWDTLVKDKQLERRNAFQKSIL